MTETQARQYKEALSRRAGIHDVKAFHHTPSNRYCLVVALLLPRKADEEQKVTAKVIFDGDTLAEVEAQLAPPH